METTPQYAPDTFQGFRPPTENWSKLPHELINALPLIETIGEMKVILYVLRHTWGYQDDEKRISLDEFQNGRKHSHRYLKRHPDSPPRIDNGTGLSVNTIKDGIERAVKHGFLEVDEDATDKARIKRWYRLSDSGDQDLTVGDQKLIPSLSEIDTRSKKETIERNIESPSTDVDDFPFTDDPPPEPLRETTQQRLERMRAKFGDNPVAVGASCQKAQEMEGQWTVTAEAGGDNPWAGIPMVAFCAISGITTEGLSKSERKEWPRFFKKWASDRENPPTPDETAKCILAIPKSELGWKTFETPHQAKSTMSTMLNRIRSGLPINAKGTGKKSNEPAGAMSNDMVAQ